MEHPAIDQLAGTPDILRQLMSGLSEAQTTWQPAPGRWSLAEVLEHLSHVEAHFFRTRFDLIVSHDAPELQDYDEKEIAASGAYSGRDPEESFAHWEEQREDNVAMLRGLPAGALRRTGLHPSLGSISLEEALNAWAFHDLGHIRQIAELVRAQLYYPGMGPFRAETKVTP